MCAGTQFIREHKPWAHGTAAPRFTRLSSLLYSRYEEAGFTCVPVFRYEEAGVSVGALVAFSSAALGACLPLFCSTPDHAQKPRIADLATISDQKYAENVETLTLKTPQHE